MATDTVTGVYCNTTTVLLSCLQSVAVGDNTRKNTAHRSSPLTLTTSVGSTPRRATFQDLDTYCPMVSVTHLQGSQHLIFRTMFGVFINITAWASVNGNHDAEWAQGPGVPCCAMLGVNPWVGQGPDCQDSFTGRVRGSCPLPSESWYFNRYYSSTGV